MKTASKNATTEQGPATGRTAERARIQSEALVGRVRDLIHEGNVRRISILNEEGHTVIEIPVTAGLVAAAVAPALVGVAAIAALASNWTLEIDRAPLTSPVDEPSDPTQTAAP